MKNKKIYTAIRICVIISVLLMLMSQVASAAIQDSTLFTGTTNLINDAMSWIRGIGATLSALFFAYSLMRRNAADETDQKKWKDRMIMSLIAGVGIIAATSLINAIVGYYQ